MKGIVLAGGTGSRLYPLTKVTNKHLLPIGNYPMIFHPIAKLAEAGILDILIITGREHMGAIAGILGSGNDFGLEFTYKVQEEAGGIAQALGLAKNFVGTDKCVVILGDNVFKNSITTFVDGFSKEQGATVFLKEVSDPQRYGVAEIIGNKIVSIVEKPKRPKSYFCVTGVYMYDNKVFDIIQELKPSVRGELEITDVNNIYLKRGELSYHITDGWWTDAGTFESLALANELTRNVKLPMFERGKLA